MLNHFNLESRYNKSGFIKNEDRGLMLGRQKSVKFYFVFTVIEVGYKLISNSTILLKSIKQIDWHSIESICIIEKANSSGRTMNEFDRNFGNVCINFCACSLLVKARLMFEIVSSHLIVANAFSMWNFPLITQSFQ